MAVSDPSALAPLPAPNPLLAWATEAAALLQLLGNEKRLLLVCLMAAQGETSVSLLSAEVGLGQAATSQHLALLRQGGLVATRRAAQTVHYRLADARAAVLLETLSILYAEEQAGA